MAAARRVRRIALALGVAVSSAIPLGACGPGARSDIGPPRADRSRSRPPSAAERAYRPPPALLGVALLAGGRLLVEGRADPDARVRLAPPSGQPFFARPAADGTWRVALPPAPQVRLFGLSMIEQGRAIQAEGYVAVTPQGDAAELRSGSGALVLTRAGAFRILALDFDRKGGAVISGSATPGAAVTASVDGAPAGRAVADSQGRYVLPLDRPLAPGGRRLGVAAGRLTADLAADVSPAAPLAGTPFRSAYGSQAWRIDWMTPGGGMQSTVLPTAPPHVRPPAP